MHTKDGDRPSGNTKNQSLKDADFDPDVMRKKYRRERDKRLREQGNDQYIDISGVYKHFLDDPYSDATVEREPLTDQVEVLIVGGGFGGLLTGARLRQAGVEDIRIIDPAADFGGTWYWNRYPGMRPVMLNPIRICRYWKSWAMSRKRSMLSALRFWPTVRLSLGKFDLYRDACFQTRVETLRWDESESCWIVSTNRKDRMKARYLCLATGPLNRPKLPGLAGIESFQGHSFHASRWDYQYTGGDGTGGLTGLADKRVGIIGTGATSVQCVPMLGESAKELYVFQRTPSSIDVKNSPPTDSQWAQALQPGWQKERMDNFNALVSGVPQSEDLVGDGWTDLIGKLLFAMQQNPAGDLSPAGIERAVELADFEKMEEIRARVDSIVKDPKTAEALKPYYRQFCKRPCFHNEYLDTYNRPSVTLIDTQGRGVDRITAKGVEVQGREYELDCLIYATGFEVGTDYSHRADIQLLGRDGVSLTEAWADGVRSLHGMHVHGFPNCFILSNSQAGFTVSYPHLLDEQAKHIAYIVNAASDKNCVEVEVTQESEASWIQQCIDKARDAGDFLENCTPGYYNNEGRSGNRNAQDGFYGGGSIEFFHILQQWRDDGGLDGLRLKQS